MTSLDYKKISRLFPANFCSNFQHFSNSEKKLIFFETRDQLKPKDARAWNLFCSRMRFIKSPLPPPSDCVMGSVTRFGDFSPIWQNFDPLGQIFFAIWGIFHCGKWSNVEQIIQPSGHTGYVSANDNGIIDSQCTLSLHSQ